MKTNLMRSALTVCAIATLAWLGSAPVAGARPGCGGPPAGRVYVSGHCHCGLPLYTERYFLGYDCHGRPQWGYREVNRHCHQVIRPVRRHPIQPQPYPYQSPGHRGGVVIHGVIRR